MLKHIAFWIVKLYAGAWMRFKAGVLVAGAENVPPRKKGERRVYIVVNHTTSYDFIALMHVSKGLFTVLMDECVFLFPFIGRILHAAGFIPLNKTRSQEALDRSVTAARMGVPLLVSLHDGGKAVDMEGNDRPRTGGIRIAHLAGSTLYPIYLEVEEKKRRTLGFTDVKGETHRFTTFKDAVYLVDFLPPITLEGLAPDPGYEAYQQVANELQTLSDGRAVYWKEWFAARPEETAKLPRWGGARLKVAW